MEIYPDTNQRVVDRSRAQWRERESQMRVGFLLNRSSTATSKGSVEDNRLVDCLSNSLKDKINLKKAEAETAKAELEHFAAEELPAGFCLTASPSHGKTSKDKFKELKAKTT